MPRVPPVGRGCPRPEFFPHRNWRTPLASQRPFSGPLGLTALPLVGRAAGCDLSEPSRVMEPSGTTSHTATAMDPVHGSHWSVSSTDITLTAKQGAALTSSYGLMVWGRCPRARLQRPSRVNEASPRTQRGSSFSG